MKRRNIIMACMLAISFLLLFVSIVQSVSKSTDGIYLATLRAQIDHMRGENDRLRTQILECSSLTTIEREASGMGFDIAKPQNYYVLRGGDK